MCLNLELSWKMLSHLHQIAMCTGILPIKGLTVLSDLYAIESKDSVAGFTPNAYLFSVSCINKVTDLPIYSYKNKLGGWNVVKNKLIQLPIDSKQ